VIALIDGIPASRYPVEALQRKRWYIYSHYDFNPARPEREKYDPILSQIHAELRRRYLGLECDQNTEI
jgi:hypothetical protein